MERKNILKANKKRRLQIFRDYIFNSKNYDFSNPHNCLVAQMVKMATDGNVTGFVWSERYIKIASEFFGLDFEFLRDIERNKKNWHLVGIDNLEERSSEQAIQAINFMIKGV